MVETDTLKVTRLLEHCKIRNAHLMKALEVNQLLSRELQLGQLLQLIMETTQNVMDAEACSLFLLDDETGDLLFQVALGQASVKLKELYRLPKGTGIAGWVAEHCKPLKIDDVYADERFNPAFDAETGFRTRNMLCIPIFYNKECIGVCQLINRKEGSFTRSDLQLLESLGQMSAVAIENAKTHQKLLKQSLLEHDLQLAHQLQQSFLPASPPKIKEYECAFLNRPALGVGGDFYEAFILPDERVAYLLGDISGKGVSAALLMSRVIRDLRFEALNGGNAGEILTRFNQTFSRETRQGMFVTIVLLILNPESGDVDYANAGHMPPAHLIDGEAFTVAGAADPPAGILPSIQYQSRDLHLGPGEALLLYTDGLTEANNPQGEMLGRERMLKWLSVTLGKAEYCIQDWLKRVQQFAGSEPLGDDITLLLLKRQSPSES
ncbi:MAG: SpoIIE family protein phosphatase [Mariprofundaceae bacterium]